MRRLTKRQRTSAIVLAVIALCLITLDLGGAGLADAHSGVRGTLGALYRGTDAVIGPVRNWVQGVPTAGTNRGKITDLEHANAELRGQVDALKSDRRTSAELSRLQASADGTGDTLVPARVIAYGPGQGFDWTVGLDAGSSAGIRPGQTVTDGAGLVGRVLHVSPSTSVVLLAADPGSGVGVRDVRSGELGIATGRGSDGFSFVPLRDGASVKVGDRLVTGPNGASSFVAGIDFGTVTSVRSAADGSLSAGVRATASPTAVDIVAVIVKHTSVTVADPVVLAPGGRR